MNNTKRHGTFDKYVAELRTPTHKDCFDKCTVLTTSPSSTACMKTLAARWQEISLSEELVLLHPIPIPFHLKAT